MAVVSTDLPNSTKLEQLTDEQIKDIKKYVEGFAKKEQYFSKFTQKAKWDRGSKTIQFRRYVANKVAESDVKPIAEEVAPRPTSITVKTFQRSIKRYGGKWKYTREDTLYGYDNIVSIGADVLSDEITQYCDYVIGKPFFSGRATQDLVSSGTTPILDTLDIIAIKFTRQNHCKPYANGKYLAMITPEVMAKIKAEISSKGSSLCEATKEQLDSGVIGSYGRWLFTECPHNLAVKDETTHYMVCLARRPDGQLPIVQSELGGVEVINNPLGTGILLDVDGKLTSDDNKQMGSIAWNIDGLTADVNDDLCLIRTEITATTYKYPLENDNTLPSTSSSTSPTK